MKRPNRKVAGPAGGNALARAAQSQLARGLPAPVPAGTRVAKAPAKAAKATRAKPVTRKP